MCVCVYVCVLGWVGSEKEPIYLILKSPFQEYRKETLNDCYAEVIFREEKPRPSIDITCEPLTEKSSQQQEDYLLYKHLKQFKPPLGAVRIPGMNQCLEFLYPGIYVITES